MATLSDLDELALAFPGATKEGLAGERFEYCVSGKAFCRHREERKDALDAETGERLADVVMFTTPDNDSKAMLLETRPDLYFTTPHFDGYPAILTRISWLGRFSREELDDVLVEAWLAKAPKRVAKAWLAEQTGEA